MKISHAKRSAGKLFAILFMTGLLMIGLAVAALAANATWKEAFEEVCGQVMGAESMSDKDLATMVEKADKLMPVIQASDDPGKKVYLMRLKKCRAVYEFILEARKSPSK